MPVLTYAQSLSLSPLPKNIEVGWMKSVLLTELATILCFPFLVLTIDI